MNGEDFSLGDFLPYLLTMTAEEVSESFSAIYKSRYGISRTEWRGLVHLGWLGEMTAHDICVRAREEKTRVSRAVLRLEQAGRLERRQDPDDRRQEILSLTPQGREVFEDLKTEAAQRDAELAVKIGSRDMEHLKSLLARLTASPQG